MSEGYPKLYRFTADGLDLFQRVMTGQVDEATLDPVNPAHAQPIDNTKPFAVGDFHTAKQMAEAISNALGSHSAQSLAGDKGLWSWLTFVLLDTLFAKAGSTRKLGARDRWDPAPSNDWLKAQRHLVRMPVLLFQSFGADADHLLATKPSVGPEIREQITSQQDMFSRNFQKVGRALYFDDATGTVRRGAGSKDGPGAPRRLAAVRKQLDVTWDMTDLSAERILDLLPAEFDRYKSAGAIT